MCSHVYAVERDGKQATAARQCPHQAFYQRISEPRASTSEIVSVSHLLPIDSVGACLFHSKNLPWKRENSFAERLLNLVTLIEADELSEYHDFTEFTFVGSAPQGATGADACILRLVRATLQKEMVCSGATFADSLELDTVRSQNLTFVGAIFAGDLIVQNCEFQHIQFTRANFAGHVTFDAVDFMQFVSFAHAVFATSDISTVVRFAGSRFRHITDFSDATFRGQDEAGVRFSKIRFEDVVDFTRTEFHCHVTFEEVSFESLADFVDTSFDAGFRSSSRYREASVLFKRIIVEKGAVLTFTSNDPLRKMFNQDAQFSFLNDPTGVLRFENVNFSKIVERSRKRLILLAKTGQVEIGSGCIKERITKPTR
jgi:uncharacterized protein YjbI with pentapeptide repeats